MVNLLLAEDNADLRRLLRIHLQRAGYTVYEAEDGARALEMFDHMLIHLLIADVMMPRMDGYALTAALRDAQMKIPVIFITAKDALEDKKRGFQVGADDYLTKPFQPEELLLRVEALLRRCNVALQSHLQVGAVFLNAESLQVLCPQGVIDLRQKEFLLLHKMLSYPNKIFTRQNLMDEIWGYDSESDPRTVDTHVKRLREKLAGIPDFDIQTIRGLGYRAVIRAAGERP